MREVLQESRYISFLWSASKALRKKKEGRVSREECRGKRREARGERREARGERWEVKGERWEVRGERWEVRGERWEVRGETPEESRANLFIDFLDWTTYVRYWKRRCHCKRQPSPTRWGRFVMLQSLLIRYSSPSPSTLSLDTLPRHSPSPSP